MMAEKREREGGEKGPHMAVSSRSGTARERLPGLGYPAAEAPVKRETNSEHSQLEAPLLGGAPCLKFSYHTPNYSMVSAFVRKEFRNRAPENVLAKLTEA